MKYYNYSKEHGFGAYTNLANKKIQGFVDATFSKHVNTAKKALSKAIQIQDLTYRLTRDNSVMDTMIKESIYMALCDLGKVDPFYFKKQAMRG